MSFKVTINASETIVLNKSVTSVKFLTDAPDEMLSRAGRIGMEFVITGQILGGLPNSNDESLKIPNWAKLRGNEDKATTKVTVEVAVGGALVREIVMTNAYAYSYTEMFNKENGNGTYVLKIRQMKDFNTEVTYDGGY